MYSLVSAPVLGFDLARLPGGAQLAGVLLTAMQLDEAGLAAVAAAQDGLAPQDRDLRAGAWLQVAAVSAGRLRARDVLSSAAVTLSAPEEAGRLSLAALLERAPLGSVDALLTCIRDDVLAWTWSVEEGVRVQSEAAATATTKICDAATAAYLAGELDPSTVELLTRPWRTAVAGLSEADTHFSSPDLVMVEPFLDRVRRAVPADMTRVGYAVERWRSSQADWATAVHAASWAVSVTERVAIAAAAQLKLVLAVREAGWPLGGLAAGDWNLLSGALQALLVRDVVPSETLHRLVAPCLESLGPWEPAGSPAA